LQGEVAREVERSIRSLCEWKRVEIVELNIRPDHIHTILEILPKWSVSEIMGMLKGKTAIKLFKSFSGMRQKPYWGNHFWSRGYCVSTIGLEEEKIRKYVKYQERKEREEEAQQKEFRLF
jgi:putative transposase